MENQQIEKPKKLIWKKWWFWLILVLVIITVISGSDDKKEEPTQRVEIEKAEKVVSVDEDSSEQRDVQEKFQFETYKEWQDSSGIKQQVIIIPTELRNEKDLFAICDELNKKTKNEKRITIRGFTDKKAADATMYVDESPGRLWEFSDKELKDINYHAVLSFDKSLATPLKLHHCEVYPRGFGNQPFLSPKRY